MTEINLTFAVIIFHFYCKYTVIFNTMQKIKASTSQEIKKLRQKMPKNYRKTLQNRTKYSLSTIDKVLSGVYINTKIIEEAIKLKAENQKKIDRIIEKIKD